MLQLYALVYSLTYVNAIQCYRPRVNAHVVFKLKCMAGGVELYIYEKNLITNP